MDISDFRVNHNINREFSGTGDIGEIIDISSRTLANITVKNVNAGNIILVKGRIQSGEYVTIATITGTTAELIVNTVIYDDLTFECTTFDAAASGQLLVGIFVFDSSYDMRTLDAAGNPAFTTTISQISKESTFSATGSVIGTTSCADREFLSVEVTGVNPTNQLDVRGRLKDGTYENIWTIIGNMPVRTINIGKFDDVDIQCTTFSSAGSGTARLSIHDANMDIDFENVTISETISGITYTATAKEPNADPTHPVWSIKREYTTSGATFTQFSNSGYYISTYTDKENEFPPAPLINEKSILFDGVNEIVSIATDASIDFDGTTAFSMSMWAKRSGPAALDVLMGKVGPTFTGYICGASTTLAQWYLINTLSSNEIQKQFTFPASVANGEWHHYCFTYDGSQDEAGCKMYLDGIEVTTTNVLINALTTSISNASALGIAAVGLAPTLVPWAGNIDEASIWNVELSASDVTELYNAGKPADLSIHSEEVANGSLVSWWRMGDGDTFPTITDQKGSNDGTMTNAEAGDIEEDVP